MSDSHLTSEEAEKAHFNFEKIFQQVTLVANNNNIPLESSFKSALSELKKFNYHREDVNDAQLKDILEKQLELGQSNPDSKLSLKERVWLTCGETGMGKSTIINALNPKELAEVAIKKGESQTSLVKLHDMKTYSLTIIDTPGLFDTRAKNSDKSILDNVCLETQKALRASSKIDALILLWSPTIALYARIECIIESLKSIFGPDVLDSMLLVVNKHTKKWEVDDDCDDALKNFYERFPTFRERSLVTDLKTVTKDEDRDELFRELCEKTKDLKPFNEEYFLKARLEVCEGLYHDYVIKNKEADLFEQLLENTRMQNEMQIANQEATHARNLEVINHKVSTLSLEVQNAHDKYERMQKEQEIKREQEINRFREIERTREIERAREIERIRENERTRIQETKTVCIPPTYVSRCNCCQGTHRHSYWHCWRGNSNVPY